MEILDAREWTTESGQDHRHSRASISQYSWVKRATSLTQRGISLMSVLHQNLLRTLHLKT